jgi:hypothetical protein
VPGTLATGPASTVEAALLMFPASKPMSGTATGEIPSSAAGVPPCQLPAAVTYLSGPSRRKISEVIPRDRRRPQSRQDIPSGSPVMRGGLRCDVTEPQARVRQGHPRKKWDSPRTASLRPLAASAVKTLLT